MSAASLSVVGMFPYPSGTPHLGHVRVYTITDVRARHARLHGREVLHPIGWDAFGLPAENAAIAHGVDPAAWTAANIARMRQTFRAMGWSFDWDREIDTSSPGYYRWTQWLFCRMLERGLAYEASAGCAYCPGCATVLADEQAAGGVCWRCGAEVEQRLVRQWFLRITARAEALWQGLERLEGWDPAAVAVQRDWIRRSDGAVVRFEVEGHGALEVFTTRAETLFGAVAVVVAPEHPLAAIGGPEAEAYVRTALRRSAIERRAGVRGGVPLGVSATHPLTGERLPVWVADYVVGDYGTGAVMCVPSHDERDRAFAAEAGLPQREVIRDGALIDSGRYTGLEAETAREAIAAELAARGAGGPEVRYRLRDWSVGRQRRWGCPIPVVRCSRCGPVAVPDSELPVRTDDPSERTCPACGQPAPRETDTLDTFVCSSWYVFRYCDPHATDAPFSRAAADRYVPVDLYVGGIEHAAQHMLYFRFVTRVLHELGMVGTDEPVRGFLCNGMVLGADGRKMSKSRRTGVDPAELIEAHGADALRLAILADVPVERELPWDPARIAAAERFLARLARTIERFAERRGPPGEVSAWPEPERAAAVARTLAALDGAVRDNALHNAVARLHELSSLLREVVDRADRAPAAARAILRDALVALHVFVPGFVEARWPDAYGPIEAQRWPAPAVAADERRRYAIQVDGRTTAVLDGPAGAGEAEVRALADASEAVAARLRGKAVARCVFVPDRLLNLVTA